MAFVFQPAQWQWELGGVIFSLIAAVLTKSAAEYQRRRSETWPISYGEIRDVTVREDQGKAHLELDYSYRVAGDPYTGIFKKKLDENEATAWAHALHGKQIAVRYDPGKPSRSRLWESDLETIVRAAGGSQHIKGPPPLTLWEQALIYPCLLLALLGVITSVATIAAALMGKTLPHHKAGWLNLGTFLPLLVMMLVARKGGVKTFRATPGWLKFLSYAVLYYTLVGGFLLPRFRPQAGNNPERIRQERAISDADYSLLIYFGAFEACYVRLNSVRESDQFHADIEANSAG